VAEHGLKRLSCKMKIAVVVKKAPEELDKCGKTFKYSYSLLEVNKGITGHEPYSRKIMKYGL
jgi:hypothetical protein